jgi:hypothetical protein
MEHQNVFLKFGHDIHEESVAPGFGGIKGYLNRWMGYYYIYIILYYIYIIVIIINIIINIIIVISWKIYGY